MSRLTILQDRSSSENLEQTDSTPSISFFFKSEAFPDSLKNTINYYGIQYMLSMGISMLNSRLAEIRQQADPPFTGASAGYGDFFVAKTNPLTTNAKR